MIQLCLTERRSFVKKEKKIMFILMFIQCEIYFLREDSLFCMDAQTQSTHLQPLCYALEVFLFSCLCSRDGCMLVNSDP